METCQRCGAKLGLGALFCGQCGLKVKDNPHTNEMANVAGINDDLPHESRCPNCGFLVNIGSKKNFDCPGCKKALHFLVNPETKTRELYTDDGKKRLEGRKKQLKTVNAGARLFGQWGVTKERIEAKYADLRKDGQNWGYSDAVWALSNELVLKNINDLFTLKMIYYSQAIFLEEEGKDPTTPLRACADMELALLARSNVTHVKILTTRIGCEVCEATNGKIFPIDVAIKEKPIPNIGCTYRMKEGHHPFCRCMYQPVIEEI